MLQLHPVTGQFRDADVERDFRASLLPQVQRDSRLSLIITAALCAMFAISDYNFLGLSTPFYLLLVLRLGVIAGCLLLAAVLHSSSSLLTRPWVYSIAPIVIAAGAILIVPLRPHTMPTQLTAVVIIIMAFYLFIPNVLWGMIGSSLFLTAGFLASGWYWAGLPPVAVMAFSLLLIMTNVVCYLVALRLARLQREQFTLLKEERLSKQRLMDEVAHRETLERQLRTMAQTDELTALSNRRHFMERAQEALVAARHRGRALSLCMIDVDNFKTINDNWGHGCGDRVLREVAKACIRVLREEEPVGRLGGEEFVAALPGADIDDAGRIAERLRESVAGLTFDADMTGLRVTVTIGVSEVLPEETGLEMALKRADAALYLGKRSGRNVVLANTLVSSLPEQGSAGNASR